MRIFHYDHTLLDLHGHRHWVAQAKIEPCTRVLVLLQLSVNLHKIIWFSNKNSKQILSAGSWTLIVWFCSGNQLDCENIDNEPIGGCQEARIQDVQYLRTCSERQEPNETVNCNAFVGP